MKVFISHYSEEKGLAEDIAEYLKTAFRTSGLEVFMASSWDSLAPGDKWEDKVINAVQETDALLVLMSWDALGRPWINFELGVAWAKKARILIFCHKGMRKEALPRPYGSLQAENLDGLSDAQQLDFIGQAIAKTLNIKSSPPERTMEEIAEVADKNARNPESFFAISRAWSLRPMGHLGETAKGRFLVGLVRPAYPNRAKAAGLEPGEALCVRLFHGTPEGPYINAMVSGKIANFFENVKRDTTVIEATIRLAQSFTEEDNTIPLLVIEDYKKI